MSVGPSVGIRAVSAVEGEHTISTSELAAIHGCSIAAVEKSTSGREVHATKRPLIELAIEAARSCLAKASMQARDVDALIFCSAWWQDEVSGRRLLGELEIDDGCHVDPAPNCSEAITALWIARSLIREDDAGNVLIISADRWPESSSPLRTMAKITETQEQDVYSDGAAAMLIAPGARSELLSFGSGCNGRYWNLFRSGGAPVRDSRGEVVTSLQETYETARVGKLALGRCLKKAHVTVEDLSGFSLLNESLRFQKFYAKSLGLPEQKLILPATRSTHVGASDVAFSLTGLMRDDPRSRAELYLIGARSLGLMRFALLNLG
jgi:3-oxoacyl-[acyl-carrier-protein] synthase III